MQTGIIEKEYEKCYKDLETVVDKISEEKAIKNFLTSDEELESIKHLNIEEYNIRLDPFEKKFLDLGASRNNKMYLTNKRLIFLKTGIYYERIQKLGDRTKEIGCRRTDSSDFVAFPLNNIYGISLRLENYRDNTSFIRDFNPYLWLAGIGFLLLLFAFLLIGNNIEMGSLMLIIGIILIILGFLLKKETSDGPFLTTGNKRELILATLDPIYKKRSSLEIRIDPNEDINLIIEWVKELQNRCDPLKNTRYLDIIMST